MCSSDLTPPVTSWELSSPEVVAPTLVEAGAEGGLSDWDEVVTR